MTAVPHSRASAPRRRAGLLIVTVAIVAQVAIAAAMVFAPRPSPYGWQMYSAVPDAIDAWAVTGDTERPIDVEAWLVHGRVEIDRGALLRAHGCARTGADSIRIEAQGSPVEEIACR